MLGVSLNRRALEQTLSIRRIIEELLSHKRSSVQLCRCEVVGSPPLLLQQQLQLPAQAALLSG